MRTARFHPLAEAELYDTAHYYEKQVSGLGTVFLDEVRWGIEQIMDNPSASALLSANVRKRLLKRFPFNLLYRIEDAGDIFILAVMHQQRRPHYWQNRTNPSGGIS